jgi:hypothetical protein
MFGVYMVEVAPKLAKVCGRLQNKPRAYQIAESLWDYDKATDDTPNISNEDSLRL